jgi:hypothetical protein
MANQDSPNDIKKNISKVDYDQMENQDTPSDLKKNISKLVSQRTLMPVEILKTPDDPIKDPWCDPAKPRVITFEDISAGPYFMGVQ